MELISAKELPVLFRKIRDSMLFPSAFAAKHVSFITAFRASVTPDALAQLCVQNQARTTALFEALLSSPSEESIREIFEQMTSEEAVFYENRLREVQRRLSEYPETFVRCDSPTDEMFWIDLLKRLLVLAYLPPG